MSGSLRIDEQKSHWKWLFLDLDNTLWDFDANAKEALKELYRRHELHRFCDWSAESFVALYERINAAYWKRYERGEVDKETLRTRRFMDTFQEMGIPISAQPKDVWQEYLEICPVMTITMPGALSAIELLSKKYKIALLTNGFEATQHIKVEANGFAPYVSFMQTSERVGLAKPDAKFFELALQQAGIRPEEAMYMGDNWDTDVVGGCGAGLNTFWYQTSDMLPVGIASQEKENCLNFATFLTQDFHGEATPLNTMPHYCGRVYDWTGFANWLMA